MPSTQEWTASSTRSSAEYAERGDTHVTIHELFATDTVGLREVSSTSVVRLQDGDHFDLHIAPVRKPLNGADLRMLACTGWRAHSVALFESRASKPARTTVTSREIADLLPGRAPAAPSVNATTTIARGSDDAQLRQLGGDLGHAVGGLVVLLVVTVLNVYKPQGLTPYGWRRQDESRTRSAVRSRYGRLARGLQSGLRNSDSGQVPLI